VGVRRIGAIGRQGLLFRSEGDASVGFGDDLTFEYTIRRSSRSKNIRITVGREGVVVSLPERVAERHAHVFVREREQWIERSLAKLEAEEAQVASRSLKDGAVVPFVGHEFVLHVLTGPSGRVHLTDQGELRVHVPNGTRDEVAAALERWYRKQARLEIKDRLDAVVARNGTTYKRIAIRDQRTRWGSCSTSGTISFNWRLMLASEAVLDYVIEHEAAHIEVRDHSKRFWALMEARVEDWRGSRDWLRRHGGTLRLT
jgi:predicted metal-dependent hydrolase